MRPDGPTAHHPELALPPQGWSSKSHQGPLSVSISLGDGALKRGLCLLPRPWACAWGSLEDMGSVLRQRESKRWMR